MKKPICKILRTNKNNNFKFTIKFLMTLDRSYIGYLGFLGIDFLESVLMYSKNAICLSRLLLNLGLFTVHDQGNQRSVCNHDQGVSGDLSYHCHAGAYPRSFKAAEWISFKSQHINVSFFEKAALLVRHHRQNAFYTYKEERLRDEGKAVNRLPVFANEGLTKATSPWITLRSRSRISRQGLIFPLFFRAYFSCSEPVFLNVYGAPESIPRNEFWQPK